MPDNFKQVVNLQPKQKIKKDKSESRRRVVTSRTKKKKSRAEEIDQVYSNENLNEDVKKELSQIDKPIVRNEQNNFFKQLSIVFFLIIIALVAFYFFIAKDQSKVAQNEILSSENQNGEWYYVQLTNEEVYYGFIKDKSADPVALERVYYNYNQISGENDKTTDEGASANIRLVKRGKESHGPDGTMNIVRSQLMYMEVLSEESKILKAILDYEE